MCCTNAILRTNFLEKNFNSEKCINKEEIVDINVIDIGVL